VVDLRPVLFVLGILLATLAGAMLVPAIVDAAHGGPDWSVFVLSAGVTLFVGIGLFLANRTARESVLNLRQAFLLTSLTWGVTCCFASVPFMLSELQLSFTDAFFESVSGITTTGSTIIADLDAASPGILLWRALLQWMGGIGIIAMAVAILPILQVGGMQIFRMESSDKSEKIKPRIQQIAGAVLKLYLALTVACIFALLALGMSVFDAVCHAMSAVSTAGFSTEDASIGHYRSAGIEWTVVLFMFLGGATFVGMAQVAQGAPRALLADSQFRWYCTYIAAFVALVTLWQVASQGRELSDALRSSAFNVVSIATTTGFVSEDYTLWGPLPVAAMFFITFVGGCTGSTAGGLKVFRFCILGSVAGKQLRQLVHPHAVALPSFNRRPISDDVVRSVLGFFCLYGMSFALLTLGLAACGLDLVTSTSSAAQALGNVGPGLGQIVGPAGTFAPLPVAAKWLLSAGMLLGRLELLTVLVLFTPRFWRR
jgi:trk system potassium uptake protein TrkH